MARKPFANSPQFNGEVLTNYIFGIQTGQNLASDSPSGLSQMMYITAEKLRAFMREGMASVYNYRGAYSSLPDNLAVGDAFYATASFDTFTQGHLYAYNSNSTWDDVTNIFTIYAKQSQVDAIDTRLTEAEDKIDAMGDGIVVKGYCTYAELQAIADPQVGWEYWVTDMNSFYLYSEDNGWMVVDSGVVQIPDITDTAHALSNAVVTQMNTDLKSAIDAIDHRLDNLEQAKGKYEVKNYKDGSVTPSGKGAWAIVEGLRGVSRVENQLCVNGDFSSASGWGSNASATLVYGTNKITVTEATAGSGFAVQNLSQINAVNGHVYLVVATITSNGYCEGYSRLGFDVNDSGVYNGVAFGFASAGTKQVAGLFTSNYSQLRTLGIRFFSTTSAVTVEIKDVILTDLTVYFGGTIPSDADTIAEIQQNYPQLLIPSEYGTRIVDSSYSGVRAYSANILEPMTQTTPNGTYSDGTYTNNTRLGDSAWAGKIDVSDIGQVTIAYDSCNGEFRYGLSNNDVSGSGNIVAECGTNIGSASVTVNTSGFKFLYMYFRAYTNGTTATLAKVRVNVGDTALAYSAYHAPSTLSLTFQGKSAGSVAEMYYPETGEVTHPLAEVDFSTLSWVTDANRARTSSLASVIKKPADPDSLGNYLSGKGYTQVPARTSLSQEGQYAVLSDDGQIIFYYTGTLPSGLFRYELATPDPSTYVTPIIDNTLLTEAGGRMATVQTGTVVDGSFDMGFITL